MKSVAKILIILLSITYGLSSCVTNKQTDLLQDIKTNYPNVLQHQTEEYRVIPGDQLNVVIYALNPETVKLFSSYTPRFAGKGIDDRAAVDVGYHARSTDDTGVADPIAVYSDGTITFPYIGKIHVEGLTLLDIRNIISAKLEAFAEGTTAEVSLFNKYFSILGETSADRITMPNTNLTIYQAISIASTIGPYADKSKVSIIRQTQGGSIVKTFDLRSKSIVDTEFYYIQPNDVIYFPQMKRKFLGTTNSFTGIFGLVTSLAGVIVFTLRVF